MLEERIGGQKAHVLHNAEIQQRVPIAKVSQVYPINLTLRRDDDAYSKGISGCCTASRESFWER